MSSTQTRLSPERPTHEMVMGEHQKLQQLGQKVAQWKGMNVEQKESATALFDDLTEEISQAEKLLGEITIEKGDSQTLLDNLQITVELSNTVKSFKDATQGFGFYKQSESFVWSAIQSVFYVVAGIFKRKTYIGQKNEPVNVDDVQERIKTNTKKVFNEAQSGDKRVLSEDVVVRFTEDVIEIKQGGRLIQQLNLGEENVADQIRMLYQKKSWMVPTQEDRVKTEKDKYDAELKIQQEKWKDSLFEEIRKDPSRLVDVDDGLKDMFKDKPFFCVGLEHESPCFNYWVNGEQKHQPISSDDRKLKMSLSEVEVTGTSLPDFKANVEAKLKYIPLEKAKQAFVRDQEEKQRLKVQQQEQEQKRITEEAEQYAKTIAGELVKPKLGLFGWGGKKEEDVAAQKQSLTDRLKREFLWISQQKPLVDRAALGDKTEIYPRRDKDKLYLDITSKDKVEPVPIDIEPSGFKCTYNNQRFDGEDIGSLIQKIKSGTPTEGWFSAIAGAAGTVAEAVVTAATGTAQIMTRRAGAYTGRDWGLSQEERTWKEEQLKKIPEQKKVDLENEFLGDKVLYDLYQKDGRVYCEVINSKGVQKSQVYLVGKKYAATIGNDTIEGQDLTGFRHAIEAKLKPSSWEEGEKTIASNRKARLAEIKAWKEVEQPKIDAALGKKEGEIEGDFLSEWMRPVYLEKQDQNYVFCDHKGNVAVRVEIKDKKFIGENYDTRVSADTFEEFLKKIYSEMGYVSWGDGVKNATENKEKIKQAENILDDLIHKQKEAGVNWKDADKELSSKQAVAKVFKENGSYKLKVITSDNVPDYDLNLKMEPGKIFLMLPGWLGLSPKLVVNGDPLVTFGNELGKTVYKADEWISVRTKSVEERKKIAEAEAKRLEESQQQIEAVKTKVARWVKPGGPLVADKLLFEDMVSKVYKKDGSFHVSLASSSGEKDLTFDITSQPGKIILTIPPEGVLAWAHLKGATTREIGEGENLQDVLKDVTRKKVFTEDEWTTKKVVRAAVEKVCLDHQRDGCRSLKEFTALCEKAKLLADGYAFFEPTKDGITIHKYSSADGGIVKIPIPVDYNEKNADVKVLHTIKNAGVEMEKDLLQLVSAPQFLGNVRKDFKKYEKPAELEEDSFFEKFYGEENLQCWYVRENQGKFEVVLVRENQSENVQPLEVQFHDGNWKLGRMAQFKQNRFFKPFEEGMDIISSLKYKDGSVEKNYKNTESISMLKKREGLNKEFWNSVKQFKQEETSREKSLQEVVKKTATDKKQPASCITMDDTKVLRSTDGRSLSIESMRVDTSDGKEAVVFVGEGEEAKRYTKADFMKYLGTPAVVQKS